MKQRGNWLVMFLKDDRGAVIILVALLLVFVLIGMAALTVDVGYLYLQKRHLQTTADAAALAAAWELPWANPAITSTALEYAGHNGIIYTEDGTVVSVTDAYKDSRAVRVEITKEYPLFFALAPPIRQEEDAKVYAMAVATRVGAEGLRPIGIRKSVYEELLGSADNIIVTKENFDWIGSGNWGFVNLAKVYGENSNKHDQVDYMNNGFDRPIYIGDIIETDTGANVGGALSKIDFEDATFVSPTVVFIPILCESPGSGTFSVTVVGFAAIEITFYEEKGSGSTSEFTMEAILIHPDNITNPPDYLTQRVVLVE